MYVCIVLLSVFRSGMYLWLIMLVVVLCCFICVSLIIFSVIGLYLFLIVWIVVIRWWVLLVDLGLVFVLDFNCESVFFIVVCVFVMFFNFCVWFCFVLVSMMFWVVIVWWFIVVCMVLVSFVFRYKFWLKLLNCVFRVFSW